VTDVSQQLQANYQKIIWDAGDLPQSLGDGTGAPEKSNDYAMVNAFLGGANKGIYICGDDYPSGLATAAGPSAVTFKSTFITFTNDGGNHRPTFGTAPKGVGTAGNAFAGDQWIIYGGCPLINDFDMMTPTGTSISQSTYLDVIAPGGDPVRSAEISKITGTSRVMIAGYSFIYIRDDVAAPIMDRVTHMRKILLYLQNNPGQPVGTPTVAVNALEQNYPNPFNPQTTIAYSLKERGRVKIDVYNVNGELVKTLLDENRDAGADKVTWNGTNNANQPVSSGVYFYKLVANNFAQTKKMVLLK
jgi:hypothetical protein